MNFFKLLWENQGKNLHKQTKNPKIPKKQARNIKATAMF